MDKRTKITIVSVSTSLLLSTGMFSADGGMNNYPLRGIHAEAASVTYYKTTSNLNMRTGASEKKSIIMTIPKGKQVTYISKSGSWFKVKYGSKTGYVSSAYLEKVKAAATLSKAASTKTVYTTTSNLNLRKKASTKGDILLTIPKGKEVAYVSTSGSWFKVKYGSKTGYVSSKYIKKTTVKTTDETETAVKAQKINKTTYQTTANLSMRSSASVKGKKILTIPKNKKVTATEKSGSWYKVSYNGKTGWVSGEYLKESYTYTSTSTTYYSTNRSVGIYTNPDRKKKKVYTLPKNYLVASTQKVVNSLGETWYRITYNGKTYYILGSTVTWKKAASMQTTSFKAVQGTNLYSSAGTAHSKLAKLPKGTIITTSYQIGDWYKITYNGKTGYVMSKRFAKYTAPVEKPAEPMDERPDGQTITKGTYYVIVDNALNLRESDTTSSDILGKIPNKTAVSSAYKTDKGWYEVSYGGKTGYVSGDYLVTKAEYDRYKQLVSEKNSYLTLDLRKESSVTAWQINQYISKKSTDSVLTGKGQAFIDAGKKYGVNALYLAAHAIHESGAGTSVISRAKNNLFGFGAYDLAPFVGAMRFSSVEKNIEYIAQEMKATYLNANNWKYKGATLGYTVKNVKGSRINSLSTGMNYYYASDSRWGEKIAAHMNGIMAYGKEAAVNKLPNTKSFSTPSKPVDKDTLPSGTLASAKTSIKLYAKNGLVTSTPAAIIQKGETFNLLEKWNNYWLKIEYKEKVYYTNAISLSSYNDYMSVYNLAHITTTSLNVRSNAGTAYDKVGTLSNYTYVELVLDNNKKPVTKNGWYQVKLPADKNGNSKTGWASDKYIARDLNK